MWVNFFRNLFWFQFESNTLGNGECSQAYAIMDANHNGLGMDQRSTAWHPAESGGSW